MKRALVLGTFDLLHPGHVTFLEQAHEFGDELWVALNSDDFVRRYKRPPIMTYVERAKMLKSLRVVDNVFPNFGAEDSKPAIIYARKGVLEPMAIVHGDDWTGDAYKKQLQVDDDWLRARDIHIEYVPYTASISTTDLIRRIADAPLCNCTGACIGQSVLDDLAYYQHAPELKCRQS